MNPWSALLNGGMLAQGRSGGNEEGCSQAMANFQDDGGASKMALRFSLLDLGRSRDHAALGAGWFCLQGRGCGLI